MPCTHSHWYGHKCAVRLFVAATADESLMPPRCDGVEIPHELVFPLLSLKQRREFEAKLLECSTVDRLYCCRPTCSKFLGSVLATKQEVRCGSCRTQTCGACKGAWHGVFGMCAVSSSDEEVKAILKQDLGFQECPGCKRVVELESGCYHMYVFVARAAGKS